MDFEKLGMDEVLKVPYKCFFFFFFFFWGGGARSTQGGSSAGSNQVTGVPFVKELLI